MILDLEGRVLGSWRPEDLDAGRWEDTSLSWEHEREETVSHLSSGSGRLRGLTLGASDGGELDMIAARRFRGSLGLG